VWLGELGNCCRRESRKLDARDRLARRQLPDHDPKRVRAVELVISVGRDHEHRNGLHSAAQQPQHVERRLVAPVHVLEHENGRRLRRQIAYEGCHDLVWHCTARRNVRELTARLLS
jgi:hypothetical protein